MPRIWNVLVPALFVCLSFSAQARKPRKPKKDVKPCSKLSTTHVQKVFGVRVEGKKGRFAKNLCSYTWDLALTDAEKQANAKAVFEAMKKKMQGDKTVVVPLSENQVSITVPTSTFGSKALAEKAFQANVKSLQKGITAEVDRAEVAEAIDANVKNKTLQQRVKAKLKKKKYSATFKMELVPVTDLPMTAAWSKKRSQLGFVYKKKIWWLNVSIANDDAENLKMAKKLALEITK